MHYGSQKCDSKGVRVKPNLVQLELQFCERHFQFKQPFNQHKQMKRNGSMVICLEQMRVEAACVDRLKKIIQ